LIQPRKCILGLALNAHEGEAVVYRVYRQIVVASLVILVTAALGCGENAPSMDNKNTDSEVATDSASESDAEQVQMIDTDILDDYLATGFVPIEPGTFILGSPGTEPCRGALTETQVAVTLTYRFEIGITETTQATWTAAGFNNPSYPGRDADMPVTYLNWYDSLAFCNRLSKYAGLETCYDLSACTGDPATGCSEDILAELASCKDYDCGQPVRKLEQRNSG
jgi:hypothetical protein